MKKGIYSKTGIYCIINTISWKMYIGKGLNIRKRWNCHEGKLNKKEHDNNHLQKAWLKYGRDNFKLLIIEACKKEELIEKEIFYISFYDTTNPELGYNMTNGGDGLLGYKHKKETIKKMSRAAKGRTIPMEQVQKRKETIANWTDEQKEAHHVNMSNSHVGHGMSEKHKKILSFLYKGKPSKRKNYVTSDKTKNKLSESMKRYWAERRMLNE